MINYIYDGTFEGLLTAIYEAYYRRQQPENLYVEGNIQQNLLYDHIPIETDTQKAEKVYTAIREKISSAALRHVFYVFLSELEDAGTWIYRYLQFGWKVGRDVDRYISDERVFRIHEISRKVSFERHRMLGLIRFKQIGENIFYASYEPDYNITGLLAPHFAGRLADQNWIIHDVKRKHAAVYNRQEWIITDMEIDMPLPLSETEKSFQNLWKQYFHTVAIDSRRNPRLQRQYMPARYWRHLIEKQL